MIRANFKSLVNSNKEIRKDFRDIVKDISNLYTFEARTSAYTMSPDRIYARREMTLVFLSRVVGKIVRLNRKSENQFLDGFIKDFNKISTKWNLVDETYELAVRWYSETDEECERADERELAESR